MHTPIEVEENIKLTIGKKEWTYYELDDGLMYDNIGKQYDICDSIQVGIYSRTFMASAKKKNKKYTEEYVDEHGNIDGLIDYEDVDVDVDVEIDSNDDELMEVSHDGIQRRR